MPSFEIAIYKKISEIKILTAQPILCFSIANFLTHQICKEANKNA